MAEPIPNGYRHPWLDTFLHDPVEELARLLAHERQVPPFYRADPADVLVSLVGPQDEVLRATVERALDAWLEQRRGWSGAQRADYCIARYVGQVTEALSLVYRLRLRGIAGRLFDSFDAFEAWTAPLDLGPGYNPWHELLRATAEGQTDRRLRPLWLHLCAGAAVLEEGDTLLDIALVGLRRMPGNDYDAAREMLWGLAAFGRALDPQAGWSRFMAKWRALKGLYPRTPRHWKTLAGPIIAAHAREAFALWWGKDLYPSGAPSPAPVKLPPPERRERLRVALRDGSTGVHEGAVMALMEEYRRYAEATGDAYNLVRSGTVLAKPIVEKAPHLALHLVGLVREWEPNDPLAWDLWGRALAAAGHPDLAEAVLWEGTHRFPDDAYVRCSLANLLVRQRRDGEAEALFRAALALRPENAIALNGLGHLLVDVGRLEGARAILAELEALHAARQIHELHSALARAERGHKVRPPAVAVGPSDAVAAFSPGMGLQRAARVARADFRLGPDLGRVAAVQPALRESLRAEAQAELTALVAQDPNDLYARLVAAEWLGWGAPDGQLLEVAPHAYALHLSAALANAQPTPLLELLERFPDEAPITYTALIARGAADVPSPLPWPAGPLPGTGPRTCGCGRSTTCCAVWRATVETMRTMPPRTSPSTPFAGSSSPGPGPQSWKSWPGKPPAHRATDPRRSTPATRRYRAHTGQQTPVVVRIRYRYPMRPSTERCQSGRMGRTRNPLYP